MTSTPLVSGRATTTAWRRGHLTIRARLTVTYVGLVTGCGAVLIGIVYLFMRYVPNYAIIGDPALEIPNDLPAAPGTLTDTLTGTIPAISITSQADILDTILLASGMALLVLATLSGIIGWVVAGRVIRPLKLINEAAVLASTGSLTHRVGLTGPHDEIRDLSITFDDMLGKLDQSFQAHRRFAANASHELRTPLATTQTMIDVTLHDPDADADTLRALAQRIHEVNRANIDTVDALLDLATIDNGSISHDPVDLRAVLRDAVDASTSEAQDHQVSIIVIDKERSVTSTRVEPGGLPVVVAGDDILIRQAVRNLMQNAIRHNVRGGTVTAEIETNDTEVALIITNTGGLVPADSLELLREPFVRAAGRTTGRGHGLGLAITASIAEAHDGSLTLTANPPEADGGLTVTIIFPRFPYKLTAIY